MNHCAYPFLRPSLLRPACVAVLTTVALLSMPSFTTAAPAQRNLQASGPEPSPISLRVPGEAAPQALYAASYALVIGASKYTNGWSPLPGVPGDVAAVSKLLKAQGFKVVELLDPTRAELDAALADFVRRYGQNLNSRVLVYYAGHGHTLKTSFGSQLGYIVPVDAPNPNRDPGGFKALAYSMQAIEGLTQQIDAKHALFIFDSCFSGTIFHASRGVPDDISVKTSLPVRQFITAGDAEQTVPDQSIFRRQLEAAFNDRAADQNGDGYITGTELGLFLESQVTNYSHKAQTPRWGKLNNPNLDKGDFVFALPTAAPTLTPAPRPGPSVRVSSEAEVEQEFWDTIKTSRDAQDYRDYLSRYPQGRYAALAQRQVRVLTQVSPTPPPVPTPPPSPAPAPSGPYAGQVIQDCPDCPKVVVLPKGSFVMGSAADEAERDGDEGPQHSVQISNWVGLGQKEVTRGEFGAFVRASGYKTEAEQGQGCNVWSGSEWKYQADKNWRNPGFSQSDSHPVVCVSWNDAQAYVKWLSGKTGQNYRLPSEAEWEYGARAGTQTRYPWGDDGGHSQQCSYANGADKTTKTQVPGMSGWTVAECADGWAYTAPVGSYRANAFGLHDMHGNVWEWVQDVWHDNYSGAPTDGSVWLSGGEQARRVLRGGSWNDFPRDLRSAIRYWFTPVNRYNSLGFRIARTF